MDDRRDRVEEGQRILAGEVPDRCSEGRGGEGTGGDDDAVPIGRRQARDFAALDLDQRVGGDCSRDGIGEAFAIDGERPARRHLVAVGGAEDERVSAAQLFVEQADGVGLAVVGTEGIGADQLGQLVGLVRLGAPIRPHLVEDDGHAAARDLPRRLRAGQTAADDVNGSAAHWRFT